MTTKTTLRKVADVGPCQVCIPTPGNPFKKDAFVWLIELDKMQLRLCDHHKRILKNTLSESRHR